jgi:putative serine protease PepD
MSDDLFWPPLSGEGDDGEDQPGDPTAAGDHPTAAYPTEPLNRDEPVAVPQQRTRRTGTAAVAAATAFVFGAGGVAVGAEVVHHNNNDSTTPTNSGAVTQVSPSSLTTSPKSYAAIAAKVLPSVVSINVTGANESDTGSGVVLKSTGYILTNNHVVAAAATGGSVSVVLNDGSTASAKIIGTDSLDDLAVIKVARTNLTPAQLGDSAAIQVGDPVLAVGSPLGLTGTVTAGIVSALNRPVETQEETQPQQSNPFGFGGGNSGSTPSTQPTVIDAIQTDAAINPGNSGGALVDAAGQVVGINSAIASLGSDSLSDTQSGNIGVGFAIPINEAKAIANELITTGHATHPLLGVSLSDPLLTNSASASEAEVSGVTSGGPADKAGIKKGDVITAIDGTETEGADAVIAAIRSHQPGQQVTVTFTRGGSSQTVTATLTTQSSSQG